VRSIGLDVHKRFAEVAIIDPNGGPRRAPRIPVTPAGLHAFAQQLGPNDQLVLESTSNAFPIAELLAQHAGRVVISNPMRTRAIADAKVKTDHVDAAVLAQLLAADFVPAVWIPDERIRALRRAVSRRHSLVRVRTRLRNQVHAVLIRNLLDCPHSDLFGRAGLRWLAAAALLSDERAQVEAALRLLVAVDAEIARAERTLAQAAIDDVAVRQLLTIPGVGPTTAIAVRAAIGDIHRFPRPTQLAGYLGLVPTVRQSGERAARTGRITKQGPAHARGILVEAALSAITVPGPLRAFYWRVQRRRGPQVAAVATARKLATLAWHMLSHGEDYRWTPVELTRRKVRALETAAGIPAARIRRPGAAQRRIHDQENLAQAEAGYRALITERARGGAVAAKGTRLNGSRA